MLVVHLLRGLVGAVVGGVTGYYAFGWALSQGYYAMVVPGALLGLGFGYLSGRSSKAFGGLCAGLALAFSLFVEWRFLKPAASSFS
jgi:hypothetical protein